VKKYEPLYEKVIVSQLIVSTALLICGLLKEPVQGSSVKYLLLFIQRICPGAWLPSLAETRIDEGGVWPRNKFIRAVINQRLHILRRGFERHLYIIRSTE
jgi:hypothetical protein